VPGGSIGSCLRKVGKFSENVTKSFTVQILEGLEYLHSQGILHRVAIYSVDRFSYAHFLLQDLKADSILVENTGICKISGFGVSKRTDDLGGAAFTPKKGTVFCIAPEVVKNGKKGYTSKVDIWSIGCVVLEMWTGRQPWDADSSFKVSKVVEHHHHQFDYVTDTVMAQLHNADDGLRVLDDVILSETAEDFRLKCFAV
jgi:serine/threonine protein kinase